MYEITNNHYQFISNEFKKFGVDGVSVFRFTKLYKGILYPIEIKIVKRGSELIASSDNLETQKMNKILKSGNELFSYNEGQILFDCSLIENELLKNEYETQLPDFSYQKEKISVLFGVNIDDSFFENFKLDRVSYLSDYSGPSGSELPFEGNLLVFSDIMSSTDVRVMFVGLNTTYSPGVLKEKLLLEFDEISDQIKIIENVQDDVKTIINESKYLVDIDIKDDLISLRPNETKRTRLSDKVEISKFSYIGEEVPPSTLFLATEIYPIAGKPIRFFIKNVDSLESVTVGNITVDVEKAIGFLDTSDHGVIKSIESRIEDRTPDEFREIVLKTESSNTRVLDISNQPVFNDVISSVVNVTMFTIGVFSSIDDIRKDSDDTIPPDPNVSYVQSILSNGSYRPIDFVSTEYVQLAPINNEADVAARLLDALNSNDFGKIFAIAEKMLDDYLSEENYKLSLLNDFTSSFQETSEKLKSIRDLSKNISASYEQLSDMVKEELRECVTTSFYNHEEIVPFLNEVAGLFVEKNRVYRFKLFVDKMVSRLREKGMEITTEEVLEESSDMYSAFSNNFLIYDRLNKIAMVKGDFEYNSEENFYYFEEDPLYLIGSSYHDMEQEEALALEIELYAESSNIRVFNMYETKANLFRGLGGFNLPGSILSKKMSTDFIDKQTIDTITDKLFQFVKPDRFIFGVSDLNRVYDDGEIMSTPSIETDVLFNDSFVEKDIFKYRTSSIEKELRYMLNFIGHIPDIANRIDFERINEFFYRTMFTVADSYNSLYPTLENVDFQIDKARDIVSVIKFGVSSDEQWYLFGDSWYSVDEIDADQFTTMINDQISSFTRDREKFRTITDKKDARFIGNNPKKFYINAYKKYTTEERMLKGNTTLAFHNVSSSNVRNRFLRPTDIRENNSVFIAGVLFDHVKIKEINALVPGDEKYLTFGIYTEENGEDIRFDHARTGDEFLFRIYTSLSTLLSFRYNYATHIVSINSTNRCKIENLEEMVYSMNAFISSHREDKVHYPSGKNLMTQRTIETKGN